VPGVTWAVRLWPRDAWPFLDGASVGDDGSVTVALPSRMLAEQYLALVPVLAVMKPWGMEAHAGRAKLVMVMPVAEAGEN
jgi:hypothetical protein